MHTHSPASIRFAGNPPPPPMSPRAGGAPRPVPALGLRIAIVEDELMVAWTLETMVEELGCEVVGTFSRGEAALAGIDPDGTDIVLMDINLGGVGLDGVDTARRLRKARACRIVFVSAYADPATRARVAELAPEAPLLRKPVSMAVLAEALADVARPGT